MGQEADKSSSHPTKHRSHLSVQVGLRPQTKRPIVLVAPLLRFYDSIEMKRIVAAQTSGRMTRMLSLVTQFDSLNKKMEEREAKWWQIRSEPYQSLFTYKLLKFQLKYH